MMRPEEAARQEQEHRDQARARYEREAAVKAADARKAPAEPRPVHLLVAIVDDPARVNLPAGSWRWTRAVPPGGVIGLEPHLRQALAEASYVKDGKDAEHYARLSGRQD